MLKNIEAVSDCDFLHKTLEPEFDSETGRKTSSRVRFASQLSVITTTVSEPAADDLLSRQNSNQPINPYFIKNRSVQKGTVSSFRLLMPDRHNVGFPGDVPEVEGVYAGICRKENRS